MILIPSTSNNLLKQVSPVVFTASLTDAGVQCNIGPVSYSQSVNYDDFRQLDAGTVMVVHRAGGFIALRRDAVFVIRRGEQGLYGRRCD